MAKSQIDDTAAEAFDEIRTAKTKALEFFGVVTAGGVFGFHKYAYIFEDKRSASEAMKDLTDSLELARELGLPASEIPAATFEIFEAAYVGDDDED